MHVTSIHLYENELASSCIRKKECDWWFTICVCVLHIASCLWLELDPDVWWCPWATALKLFNIQQHCVSVCTIWPPFQCNDPATTMWLDRPVKQIGASVWQYRQTDRFNNSEKRERRDGIAEVITATSAVWQEFTRRHQVGNVDLNDAFYVFVRVRVVWVNCTSCVIGQSTVVCLIFWSTWSSAKSSKQMLILKHTWHQHWPFLPWSFGEDRHSSVSK